MIVNAQNAEKLTGQLKAWAYNCLDCTGTLEVWENLTPLLTSRTARTYAFERACQAPAMAMMRRGILINGVKRNVNITQLTKELKIAAKDVDKFPLIRELWDGTELETGICPKNDGKRHRWPKGEDDSTRRCKLCNVKRTKRAAFNPGSAKQSNHLFYDLIGIPEMLNQKQIVSTDESVLIRIAKKHEELAPLVDAILCPRGIKKQLGTLKARLTPSGRFPSSFNVGTAWTGRWSSSKNPFGLGSNAQNVDPRHRDMFIADPGYEMFYADLAQAESKIVAYISNDKSYIEAHEVGNVHVNTGREFWPSLPWTGDDVVDKKMMQSTVTPWKENNSYYDQSKRNQHGLNFGLTMAGLARQAQMPAEEAQRAFNTYYENYPYIAAYHKELDAKVEANEVLVTPLLRECSLFGRPWDGHTKRQAYSYKPQSTVGDIINIAIWRLWNAGDPALVQLLAQVHDAILGQYLVEDREKAHALIKKCMNVPIMIGVRVMTIDVDIEIGQNWGKHSTLNNPKGMQ